VPPARLVLVLERVVIKGKTRSGRDRCRVGKRACLEGGNKFICFVKLKGFEDSLDLVQFKPPVD
jgi:hypothetical protein